MSCSVSILASDRERARIEVDDSPRWAVLGKNTELRGSKGMSSLVDIDCFGGTLEDLNLVVHSKPSSKEVEPTNATVADVFSMFPSRRSERNRGNTTF